MAYAPDDHTTARPAESCVVLAGGAGRRLGQLTGGRNKHLVEIEGRPAFGHVLDTVLATVSVRRLVVVTTPESVPEMEALLAHAGEQLPITVRAQIRPAGTLDAVRTALPDVEHETFAVHYADNLFGWRRLPPLAPAMSGSVSACLYTVDPPEDWRRFASVTTARLADGLRATDLEEKPDRDEPPRGAGSLTGLFRFDTRAFRREAPRVRVSPRGELELTDVVHRLIGTGAVRVLPVASPWIDFGTEQGLHAASSVLEARGLSRA